MAELETPTVALTGVSEVVLRKRKTLAEIKEKRQALQKHKVLYVFAGQSKILLETGSLSIQWPLRQVLIIEREQHSHNFLVIVALSLQPAPKKKIMFRRAEEFVRDHRARAKDTMRVQRVVKKQKALKDVGKPVAVPDGKLALVIRIFPTKGACMKTRKILQHFRLWQLYSAVFVRLDEKSLASLKQVCVCVL